MSEKERATAFNKLNINTDDSKNSRKKWNNNKNNKNRRCENKNSLFIFKVNKTMLLR